MICFPPKNSLAQRYRQLVYRICYALAGKPDSLAVRPPSLNGYRRKRPFERMSRSKRTQRKREILRRDGYRCQYCGLDMLSSVETFMLMSLDHVVPYSGGGGEDSGNLVTACLPCNTLKGFAPTMSIEEGLRAIRRRRGQRVAEMQAIRKTRGRQTSLDNHGSDAECGERDHGPFTPDAVIDAGATAEPGRRVLAMATSNGPSVQQKGVHLDSFH